MNVGKGLNVLLTALFITLFFAFLFGPLVIMVITAFNSSVFPRISPWDCFTTDWFRTLAGDRMLLSGLLNTMIIGAGVIIVAVPVGLAGALALAEASDRLRSILYTVMIVPILLPGVVIGISTIIFWNWLSYRLGDLEFLTDGIFLSILGQVTFIAAYSMLVFTSRLQRYDFGLTEAALDLGATPGQAFRKVLLPFLRPAIASAAVLAFLSSAENYNTTAFTIGAQSTFTTVLASKVRYGINPSISAVAVIIIAITLVAAIINEVHGRRRHALLSGGRARARIMGNPILCIAGHPAFVALILLVAIAAAVVAGGRYDSSVCTARILEEKRALQEKLMQQMTPAAPASETTPAPPPPPTSPPSTGGGLNPYSGVFGGGSLPGPANPAPPATPPSPSATSSPSAAGQPTNPYANVFSPGNLPGAAAPSSPPAPPSTSSPPP
ncbi:spermidine/putrescine transport system permease protein [Arboricoccus pini]|uniref:Spermidine/putrescine transport system permease protein n=1 Tax=Arboricoccus pini TaxID=1963835 RepID=A0A212PY52_9PROT|nr:ABC transporter permease [Arboricoccus pini]SNB51894.1 spermidine/putrescine transport system permease protein [Arboricoccus pini]